LTQALQGLKQKLMPLRKENSDGPNEQR